MAIRDCFIDSLHWFLPMCSSLHHLQISYLYQVGIQIGTYSWVRVPILLIDLHWDCHCSMDYHSEQYHLCWCVWVCQRDSLDSVIWETSDQHSRNSHHLRVLHRAYHQHRTWDLTRSDSHCLMVYSQQSHCSSHMMDSLEYLILFREWPLWITRVLCLSLPLYVRSCPFLLMRYSYLASSHRYMRDRDSHY